MHLAMVINFFSSKDSEEIRTMCIKSDDIEIMMGSETDETIEKLFESLLQGYQKGLEESLRGSKFVFDSVNLLYYELHKISLNRGGSYIDSHKCLKNKKPTINPKNNDDKCFQYTLIALSYQNVKNNSERLSKIMLFIDQYNLNEIINPLLLILYVCLMILKK